MINSFHIRAAKALVAMAVVASVVSACATPPAAVSFDRLQAEKPASILVLPALNNTVAVNAPEYFLSTVSRPFGNRGYYIFPANMIRKTLEDGGLADAGLVHQADPRRLKALFGCDAALYIEINRWDSQYIVLSTTTTVEFKYVLKSCSSGEELWSGTQMLQYSPQQSNSGNPLADLVAAALVAALQKAAPNYIPLAQQANLLVSSFGPTALPAGPLGLTPPPSK
jgi:hypothetical protein